MADEQDYSKMSNEELMKLAGGKWEKTESEPAPKKILKAGVQENVEKGAQKIVKNMFPSDSKNMFENVRDAANLPLSMGSMGFMQVPEDIANAGLGLMQQNVQPPNRASVGDIARQVTGNPTFATPSEVLRSQAYQNAVGQNPLAKLGAGAASTGASFLFPLKLGLAGKMMPAVRQVEQAGAPALQMLKQIAQSPNGLKMLQLLKATPQVQHVAGPAAAGAAFAPVFGAGAQFGQNRTMPNANQVGQQATAGAVLGGGMGLGASLVNQLLLRKLAGQVAKQVPPPPPLQSALQRNDLRGPVDIGPKAMSDNYLTASNKLDTSGFDPERIVNARRKLFATAAKQPAFQPTEDGGPEALAKLRKDMSAHQAKEHSAENKLAERKAAEAEKRQFTAKQQKERLDTQKDLTERRLAAQKENAAAKSQERQQEKATTTAEKTEHSGDSGGHYRDLYDRIDRISSPARNATRLERTQLKRAGLDILSEIERDIHDSGVSSDGSPLLRSHQRNNLMSALSRKRRSLSARPGETNGGGDGSKPSPIKGEPESQTGAENNNAGGNGQNLRSTEEKPQLKPASAESFLTEINRKTLDPQYFSARNRYKVAISADALGNIGKLEPAETEALKQSVEALSIAAVDREVAKKQLGELTKWALENTDKWEPRQGDITKTFEKDGMALAKYGQTRKLLFKGQMVEKLEAKTGQQLSYLRHTIWEEGRARGDHSTKDLVLDPNPTMSVTVNGKAGSWSPKENGGLKVEGMEKTSPPYELKPPKNLEELYNRAVTLQARIDHNIRVDKEIRDAQGEYDFLENGTRPIDLLQKAFKNREDIWKQSDDPSEIPAAHVWHVDPETDYVTTVRFERQRLHANFNEATRDLQKRYNDMAKEIREKEGKLQELYSVKWLLNSKALKAFTGLEPLIFLHAFMAKGLHAVGAKLTRNSFLSALTVGTVDNIIKARGGRGTEIHEALHNTIGDILGAFARENSELAPISGAEDLTNLLNEFKGTKLNKRAYEKAAIEAAYKANKTTEPEQQEALARARTALFIRKQYKALADQIKGDVEEYDARALDIQKLEGQIDPKRLKGYAEEDFVNGRLRDDVYDKAYHEALKTLHKSLSLQEVGPNDPMSQFMGRIASRQYASIFGNNFSTGFANFFDAGIPTLLHFHKHFARAFADLMFNPEIREFVAKLPIVPQADMEHIVLEESRKRRPVVTWTSNPFKATAYKFEDLQHFLGVTMDPVFRGKERIVSLADRLYSTVGTLASLYKHAEANGIEGHDLLHELTSGDTWTKGMRARAWNQVSKDMNQLYNSVAPHLNRDMLGQGAGKMIAPFSVPLRRNFRLYWEWLLDGHRWFETGGKEGSLANGLKAAIWTPSLVLLGGRAVIPKSVRQVLYITGAMTGAQVLNEKTQQGLDDMNFIRRTTGIDLSDRLDMDVANIAPGPALQAVQEYANKALKIAHHKEPDMVAKELQLLLGETMALIPRIGPFGGAVWKKALNNLGYANKGYKTYYIQVGTELKPVTIPGYDVGDAVRDTLIPGLPPKAFAEQQRIRMSKARRDS